MDSLFSSDLISSQFYEAIFRTYTLSRKNIPIYQYNLVFSSIRIKITDRLRNCDGSSQLFATDFYAANIQPRTRGRDKIRFAIYERTISACSCRLLETPQSRLFIVREIFIVWFDLGNLIQLAARHVYSLYNIKILQDDSHYSVTNFGLVFFDGFVKDLSRKFNSPTVLVTDFCLIIEKYKYLVVRFITREFFLRET